MEKGKESFRAENKFAEEKINTLFKKKLMFQYSKKEWPQTIQRMLNGVIRQHSDAVSSKANVIACKRAERQAKETYKNHIEKPVATLGSRFNYLFFGEF